MDACHITHARRSINGITRSWSFSGRPFLFMGRSPKRIDRDRDAPENRQDIHYPVSAVFNRDGMEAHCPKTFQQKFMLARITPNRASFKSLYKAKIPYFASVKKLSCI